METEVNVSENTREVSETLNSFLGKVMMRRHRVLTQLAADLGISHASVSRWLSGKDKPSLESCRRLANYTGLAVENILAIVGHLPQPQQSPPAEWPEFREYVARKYANELDDDVVAIIEQLIQRRRERKLHPAHDGV
jgi:transcriptional regulator with XRE-family HTH domain